MSDETVMTVRVALPSRMLGTWRAVSFRGDGAHGSFGLLPRHTDFVVVLEPGLVEMRLEDGRETYLAVDAGVLVKRGRDVFVSTRRGVESADLDELRLTVREVFRKQDAGELRARSAASKLEVSFVRRMLDLEGLGG